MATYTTTEDYIAAVIAPADADNLLTAKQRHEVAFEMTEWNSDGKLVEREDQDFWQVVANILGDN